MIEYVYRRSGARLWRGRYRLGEAGPISDVALKVTDRLSAEAKLRALVVEAEREAQGLVAPKAQREAAQESLSRLIAAYEADLGGRHLAEKHVQNTCARLRRTVAKLRWRRLADIRVDQFVTYRAGLKVSAKTRKEYGVSWQAFCRWLVATGRAAVSPMATLPRVETRGEAVRTARPLTAEELAKLCQVAPARAWIYRLLAYTGMRVNELRRLDFAAVMFTSKRIVLRADETKGREERVIPLHPVVLHDLLERPVRHGRVVPAWPKRRTFWKDLKAAGIDRQAAGGRCVHWHSFRKTFATLAAASGVSQKAVQTVLGHADPAITANVYTVVAAADVAREVARMPSVGHIQAPESHSVRGDGAKRDLRSVLAELLQVAQLADSREIAEAKTSLQMVGDTGLEPVTPSV